MEYRALYLQLSKELSFDLSPEFAASVATRIADRSEQSTFRRFLYTLVSAVAIIAGATALLMVIPQPLAKGLLDLFRPMPQLMVRAFSILKTVVETMNGNIHLLLFAGLILLFVAFIDRFLFHVRWKRCLP
jgi:hypothetical protein